MFATTHDATRHYRDRAVERALPARVEWFLRMWGTELWAAGATQITLFRKHLPAELRDTRDARRAEGWILVAAPSGALITCYRRRDAWRFIQRKSDHAWRRRHRPRR